MVSLPLTRFSRGISSQPTCHHGELAHGKSVEVGNRKCTYVASKLGIKDGAVDFESPEWIGAVQNDHFDAVFETGLHG